MYNFIKNLKYLRKVNKITQKELALKLEISEQAIKMIETNQFNPSLEILIKIRNLFNVNLDDLIFSNLEDKS